MIRHIKKRKVCSRFTKKNERARLKVQRLVTGKQLEPVINKWTKCKYEDKISNFKDTGRRYWWSYSSARVRYWNFGIGW